MYYQCRACRHQTTLLSGTMLASTKSPLRLWVMAMYLLTSIKTNVSALELSRILGIACSTAWRMEQKIIQAMVEREAPRRLDGFMQVDDAYLGGERNGGKVGRGAPSKQAFVAVVETDEALEHRRFTMLEPMRSFDKG